MNAYVDQDYISSVTALSSDKENFLYTVRMPNIVTEGNLKFGLKEYA